MGNQIGQSIAKILVTSFTLSLLFSGMLVFPGVQNTAGKLKAESGYSAVAADMLAGPHAADELLVKYKPGSFKMQEMAAEDKQVAKAADYFLVKLPAGKVLAEEIVALLQDPEVESVQPNYDYKLLWTQAPTTAKPVGYSDLKNWYYNSAKLPEMWKDQGCPTGPLCGGSSDVVVAVIDSGLSFEQFDDRAGYTGVLYNANPEYSGINLYTNSKEVANNGKDDDCNGVVDDVNGADTYMMGLLYASTCVNGVPVANLSANYRKAGHPVDTYGHGSFVTGNIAGNVVNGATVGLDSVSPAFKVKIMPIAISSPFIGAISSASIVRAIDYARVSGAHIINMSLGGTSPDSAMKSALDRATNSGILVVAASGNDSGAVNYPAKYSNVLAVGAANESGTKSSYSSYGSEIAVVAYVGAVPGLGVGAYQSTLSCFSGVPCSGSSTSGGFITNATFNAQYSVGTSFAAPQVAALAALIKSRNFSLSASQIRQIITSTAKDLATVGKDNLTGYGAIDFQKAWKAAEIKPEWVFRFWSDKNQKHFYTISEPERAQIVKTFPSYVWRYERIAFSAYQTPVAGFQAVYRFWSDQKQAHFYTISEAEKNDVIAKYPANVWKYERVAFYASNTQSAGTKALYRFWSDQKQTHFYTGDAGERDQIIRSYPTNVWRYEGVAFYVF